MSASKGRVGRLRLRRVGFAVAAVMTLAIADALSNIVSHAAMFADLVTLTSLTVNGKVYFEIGLLAMSLLFAFGGRWDKRHVGIATMASTFIMTIGLFACLFAQELIIEDSGLGIAALIVFGAGFIGVKLFIHYLLFTKENLALLVMCVACGKVVKTIIGFFAFSLVGDAQVVLTAALVLLEAIGLVVLLLADSHVAFESRQLEAVSPDLSVSYLLARAGLASIILASMQAFTSYGVYGDSFLDDSSFYVLFSFFTLLVPLFAWYFFVRPAEKGSLGNGYRNSFLIILSGLFIVSVQSSGTWILSSQVSTLLLTILEMMGHVVFWTAIISACWLAKDKAMGIIGGTMALFAVASILWIIVMQNMSALITTLILIVAYASVVALLKLFPRISIVKASEKSLVDEEYLYQIAQKYDLSARETDVFLLLAQGRSRRYIAQELFISDGTAKSHISRIYHKLGVKSKQEMISVVFDS